MVQEDRSKNPARGGGLTPLSEILAAGINPEVGTLPSPEQTRPAQETKTEGCTCITCGAKFQGEVSRYPKWSKTVHSGGHPRECPQCRVLTEAAAAREEEEELQRGREEVRDLWRRQCGMPPELLKKNFDNWDWAGKPKTKPPPAHALASEWAKDFNVDSPTGYRSLIFYSDTPGVGKGHLMAAIVNYVIDNWKGRSVIYRCPIRFESGPSLVRRIRATYNLRERDNEHEREDEVYRSLAGVALLLLDDVGKETPSKFTRETYWYIIDERVKTGLPVIISSRLKLEGANSLEELMGVDTVDRIYGMARGKIIKMVGESYRREHKVP